jgi:PadR family transcriptional regulator, regulatory protein PadR
MSSFMPQPTFWILATLAAGPRHGYDIMRETAEASGERVSLKATTLYAALDRLEADELIRFDREEVVNGRARRYYRITEVGSARLADEVELVERSAQVARANLSRARPAVALPRVAVA